MGAEEIALRIREKLLQLTEQRGMTALSKGGLESLEACREFPRLPDPDGFPADAKAFIREECDAILRGEWHVLRGTTLQVNLPPDWHRDYAGGARCDQLTSAHRLDHRALPGDCDPRLVWETSRFIQLVRLAQLAWLQRDRALAEKILDWLEDWRSNNPLGEGLNWTSPMEPGIRLINLAWIDALLADLLSDSVRYARLIDELVCGHVWWVWRYHSFGSSANNHLLGELTGLIVAAARWPACVKYGTSAEQLCELMWREVDRQFADDGGNREEALHYHLFAWEMCWQSVRGAQALGLDVPVEVTDRLARAGSFFADLVVPEEPWDFGDSDDAHITPVYAAELNALAEWRSWFRHEPGGACIAAWFGQAPESSAKPVAKGHWHLYADSGYAVAQEGELFLRLDLSGPGFAPMAAHGHMDALHLSLWHGGQALVVDPGTGAYFSDAAIREYLTSRLAHNGPAYRSADGYPARRGPFLWGSLHDKPTVEELTDNGLRATVSYGRQRVTRAVEILSPGAIRVRDWLHGFGEFQIFWQFPPGSRVAATDTVTRNGIATRLKVNSDLGLGVSFKEGARDDAAHGLCSPSFGRYAAAPGLLVEGRSDGIAQVETVFVIEHQ
jgi:hypothetical protein